MPHRSRFILAAVTLLAFGQEAPINQILVPPPDSAHPSPVVRFIARTDGKTQPHLDGKPFETQSPLAGVLTAELKPSPGVHELTLGPSKIRFFTGPNPSAEWKTFRSHSPVARCETCHAVRNGEWRFIRASLSTVCSQCHGKETFPAKHTHEMGILPDCQLCHDPHGSTSPGHMKLSRDNACKQCHG